MFSIIIPLYNKELTIAKTIQSVINQTYEKFEIIVINDGSTDDGPFIVKNFNDHRISLITTENSGVSNARNRGILEAKFDYIAFLDADDLWEITYLEEMKNLILEFPNSSIYGSNFDYLNKERFIERNTGLESSYKGKVNNYFEIANKISLYWTSTVILKKQSVLLLGGFDPRISMGEDLDLWFRMVLNFEDPIFYNKTLGHYNLDEPNRAMKRKHKFEKSFLSYFGKYVEWEKVNNEFSSFINNFKSRKLVDLFNNYDVDRKLINNYIKQIDKTKISKKWIIFCFLPYTIQKQVARYYK